MKSRITIPSLIAVALAALAMIALPNLAASKSKSGLRSFHGTVVSVTEANDGFTIRRSNDSTVDFTVGENTVFKHLGGGIAKLVPGLAVEVKAKGRAGDTPRFARKVEADGADGKADDKGGSRGGHGADDPAGDDRGSGGHGADDPAGDDKGGSAGGHGADDPAGDDHGSGGHGADDPAGDDKGGKSGKGSKGADDNGSGHGGRGGDD